MNEQLIFVVVVVALFLARFAAVNIRVAVGNIRVTFAGSMPEVLPAASSRKLPRAKGGTR